MKESEVNAMNDIILYDIGVESETTIHAIDITMTTEEKLIALHTYLKEEFPAGCRGVQCSQCPFMIDHELLPVCNVLCKRVQTQHEEKWRKNMEKKSW